MITFGIDLGANSIGWTLLNFEENKIIDMGVRIFPAGVENYDTGKEASKTVARREARSARRRIERRRMRKNNLWNILLSNKIVNIDKDAFDKINPYQARTEGVEQQISLEQFGRALYHIAQRRGYINISDVTSGTSEDKGAIYDGKEGQPGINEIRAVLESGQFKTVGAYLASLDTHEKRARCRFTERSMFQAEFEMLWKEQQKYHTILQNSELRKDIYDAIFFQRPLKSQKQNLAWCRFEKHHQVAAKSHPSFQLFRIFNQVNNFKVYGPERYEDETALLTENQRQKVIDYLINNEEIKLGKGNKAIAKILGFNTKLEWTTNLDHQGTIQGNKTRVRILKRLTKEEQKSANSQYIFDIWHTLVSEKLTERIIKLLMSPKKFGLSEETAKNLTKIKLEAGTASLSARAMKKLIPKMEEGLLYHEAATSVGYKFNEHTYSGELLETLPRHKSLRNPVVDVALYDLRRLINAILNRYGRPDKIVVEMARDLNKSKDERSSLQSKNKKNQVKNDKAKEDIKEYYKSIGGNKQDEASKNDILKYNLWKDQNMVCLYSGKQISLEQLFSGNVDIDHIIPYSRSLDDSYVNKVVCFRTENANKSNKTPYQAFGDNLVKLNGILDRAKSLIAPKYNRIKAKDEDLEQFFGWESRMLNDSRYIAREAKSQLQKICKDVQVSNGQLTAFLRHLWGLNSVLAENEDDAKNRFDHRHHAVDAVVVALSTRSMLQRLSTLSGRYDRLMIEYKQDTFEDFKAKFAEPWTGLRNQVRDFLQTTIVSYRLNKNKVNGALHEETYYGRRKNVYAELVTDASGKPVYYTRKSLSALTGKQIHAIVDPKIKAMVLERMQDLGADISESNFKIPTNAFNVPFFIGKTIVKNVRIAVPASNMINIRGYNLWVEPGSNHHIVVYKDLITGKQSGKVVSTFQAMQRVRQGLDVIDRKLDENKEFMYSLQKLEYLLFETKIDPKIFEDKANYREIFNKCYVVSKLTGLEIGGKIHSFSKSLSAMDNTEYKRFAIRKSATSIIATKIKVDELGFISLADD